MNRSTIVPFALVLMIVFETSGCGRTELWFPPLRPVPAAERPPDCKEYTGRITISFRPAPPTPPAQRIMGHDLIIRHACTAYTSSQGDPVPGGFSQVMTQIIGQDPQNIFYTQTLFFPIAGHYEQVNNFTLTFEGRVQGNWCVEGTVLMSDGTRLPIDRVFSTQNNIVEGSSTELAFWVTQSPDMPAVVTPAFPFRAGCLDYPSS